MSRAMSRRGSSRLLQPRPTSLTRLLLPPALLLLLLSGCASEPPGPFAESFEVMAEDDEGMVSLVTVDAEGLAELVQGSPGKVVLIDFWATWCGPCMRQFPHTVELHRFYREDNLRVVSVSMDDATDRDAVLEFLRVSHADFDNFIAARGASSESFEQFGITDGGIPYYRLYDKWGQQRYEFMGPALNLQTRIDELLAEQQPAKLPATENNDLLRPGSSLLRPSDNQTGGGQRPESLLYLPQDESEPDE